MDKSRHEIGQVINRLRRGQSEVSLQIMSCIEHEDLQKTTRDGFTVQDTLQMWVHEIRSHHRELIMARGPLINDNPHYHVPHFVRQANEEFGKFIGELSALSDEDLKRSVPPDGRTIGEVAEHVLATLETYVVQQLQGAVAADSAESC